MSLGAVPDGDGVRFRVWAPERRLVELVVSAPAPAIHALEREPDGTWWAFVRGLRAGARYAYRLDGVGPFPDPCSRFQPEGVHAPSEVIDPAFAWTDDGFAAPGLDALVLYELHVGTFTREGTFAAAASRLPWLRDLGVTAVQLMPVHDFPGRWNWGYDGVSLFAPSRAYGRPDDLRLFVDRAHALGLAVHLDVVYNHFGPDGAYQGQFSPHWYTDRHRTPWGRAINLDGRGSEMVRRTFVENALHWVREYHVDGLRLDATHAWFDDRDPPFLAEFTEAVRSGSPRPVTIVAEDHRNLAPLLRPQSEGGWGCDAVWTGDFHHQLRRLVAGDADGYYRDYRGDVGDLAATIRQGWFFTGQRSAHRQRPWGTDPAGLPPRSFVVFLQNHDQVGNRAFGERLNQQVDAATWRALTALLLLAPETPLLFMGQEWAASSPFLFFTDHHAGLGPLVRDGRRREFARFAAFADPALREKIPDPQDETTFERSRLDWTEATREPHASCVRLYRALLARRRQEPLLRQPTWDGFTATAAGDALLLRREHAGRVLAVAIQLRGAGTVAVGPGPWRRLLTTEDTPYADDALPIVQEGDDVRFARPGAAVLAAL